ncbi:MAG: Transaldolase [Alphaproteobacteria bacterium MarineAlpha11_Bin1]|nr:MAG: Transaldolase [Alphaproteobacteria bacterium MarineAlpha11_Bin1]|tara:strand:+ start:14742 stop:15488 length:747 start_codon:yes stop_codon:yes gene_type:complete
MTPVSGLNVQVFADGADLDGIAALAANALIKGFTTNPTLMRKAGIEDYESFARNVLEIVPTLPVSFEVFADDFDEMETQARAIAAWGDNVNVKIPITNTKGEFAGPLVERLSNSGISVNVTALMEMEQVEKITACLDPSVTAFVSVFAGRIADTGRDPIPIMTEAVACLAQKPTAKLIWASPRELLNIFHAEQCGCQVITVTTDVLEKLPIIGKDLAQYSLETVEMFYRDATSAGYRVFGESQRATGE